MNMTTPIARPTRESLPLRDGVGVVLFNGRGEVWLGSRAPRWMDAGREPIWQLPQGGLKGGELPLHCALRELGEETGARDVTPIAVLDRWLSYELPDALIGRALKGCYRGQRQLWFAMRYDGSDDAFDIRGGGTAKSEFTGWAWATGEEAVARVVPWKREIYMTVFAAFDEFVAAPRQSAGAAHRRSTPRQMSPA